MESLEPTPLQQKYKRFGRPIGARNYAGISHIARTMKARGLSWLTELIDSYQLYKSGLAAYNEYIRTLPHGVEPRLDPPDAAILQFWAALMPYIALKMTDRETRGERPKKSFKGKITPAAIERLAQLEGRKQ